MPATVTYVSVKQAAEALGVTDKTFRSYIADGLVPAFRVGPKFVRIRVDDLEALARPIPTAAAS
ncbi:MAG: helix-turn-helix domain-containing protein [Aeromicrobium sp.]